MNDTVELSVSMKYGVNGKTAKANVCGPIFANFERERESQVAISVMLFVIVFKDWFANFVLAASSRLDHDWCYLVTLACSWFASNKLRI